MNIDDYLIDQSGRDWVAMLSGWSELLPTSLTVWLVNRFGDVVVVTDDESVHLLDIGVGIFRHLAGSRKRFAELMNIPKNANNWLAIPLVDRCVAAGLVLGAGQCYGYKDPPLMGGEYSVENVTTVDLAEYYAVLAGVWRQAKNAVEKRD
uniref:T6SS immunity protein Tdi1 C-terminal domain-containing protein n=1 Tax=Solibacter usitatus (strain Ellin6076) TaxID=234267 RepID=Q01SI6_SOLUE